MKFSSGAENPGFKKGQSGNPGGRPRLPDDVKELARSYTTQAIETLAGVMLNKKASPAARIAAAAALLDRGWGKPNQHISGDADRNWLSQYSMAERRQMLMEKMGIEDEPLPWEKEEKARTGADADGGAGASETISNTNTTSEENK